MATGESGNDVPSDWRFSIAIAASSQALSEARKYERVPIAIVFPCPSDLKTGLPEKALNPLVCELITEATTRGAKMSHVTYEAGKPCQ